MQLSIHRFRRTTDAITRSTGIRLSMLRGLIMKTFKQWIQQHLKNPEVYGRLAEDGYAFYLEQQLGRTPTITEVKKYGKITLLTTD